MTTQRTHRVFVYGTLLSGFGNHDRCLGPKAEPVARTRTANAHYRMVEVSYFPGVFLDGTDHIVGEVYDVTDHGLHILDSLEGFPQMYTRVQVTLDNLMVAWMYIYNSDRGNMRDIPGGDFRAYRMMVDAAKAAGMSDFEEVWDSDDDPDWDEDDWNAMAPDSRGLDLDDYTDNACDGCGELFHREDAVVTDGTFSAHQRCYDQAMKA